MQPPSLTFQRQLRKAGPVSLSFVPSSDPSGRDVRIARAHLVLLTDLFLVCAPVEPADEHAASPGADFWLLYPPLAGKHLRVRDGAGAQQAPGEFEVAIMGKERLTFRARRATSSRRASGAPRSTRRSGSARRRAAGRTRRRAAVRRREGREEAARRPSRQRTAAARSRPPSSAPPNSH